MAIDFTFFSTVMQETIWFNVSWIINIIATLISLAIITRDTNKWKTLAFPVMVAWHIAGFSPSLILYIASALMMAIDSLSLQGIGNLSKIFTKEKTTFEKELDKESQRATRREIRKTTGSAPESKQSSTFGKLTKKQKKDIIKRGLGKL